MGETAVSANGDVPITFAHRSNKVKSNGDSFLKYHVCTHLTQLIDQSKNMNNTRRTSASSHLPEQHTSNNAIIVVDFKREVSPLSEKRRQTLINAINLLIASAGVKKNYLKLLVIRLDMNLFDHKLSHTASSNKQEENARHGRVFNSLRLSDSFAQIRQLKLKIPVLFMPLYGDDACENDVMSINEKGNMAHLPAITSADVMINLKGSNQGFHPHLEYEDIDYMIADMGGSQDISRYYLLPIVLDFEKKARRGGGILKSCIRWFCLFQLMYLFFFEFIRATIVSMYVGGYKGKVWRHQDFTILVSRLVDPKIRKAGYAWYCAQWYFNGLPHGSYYNFKSDRALGVLKHMVFMMPTNVFTYLTFMPIFAFLYFVATNRLYGYTNALFDAWWYGRLGDYLPSSIPDLTILNTIYLFHVFYFIRDIFSTVFLFIFQSLVSLKYFKISYDTDNATSNEDTSPSTTSNKTNARRGDPAVGMTSKGGKKSENNNSIRMIIACCFIAFPILSFTTTLVIIGFKIHQLLFYIYSSMAPKFNK